MWNLKSPSAITSSIDQLGAELTSIIAGHGMPEGAKGGSYPVMASREVRERKTAWERATHTKPSRAVDRVMGRCD